MSWKDKYKSLVAQQKSYVGTVMNFANSHVDEYFEEDDRLDKINSNVEQEFANANKVLEDSENEKEGDVKN